MKTTLGVNYLKDEIIKFINLGYVVEARVKGNV